jgi:hypothetical protein
MRLRYGLVGIIVVGSATLLLPTNPAGAVCSVFDKHPCMPTVCSVFRRGPCIPEIDYPIGQDLRLTIETVAADENPEGAVAKDDVDRSDHKLATLRDMFDALRACWVPPPKEEARLGMQMSVRFAFKRSGEIIAPPRVTYTSPDAPPEARETYHDAITSALARCTPLPFTAGLGGAVAGRPIAIRFVDNRKLKQTESAP